MPGEIVRSGVALFHESKLPMKIAHLIAAASGALALTMPTMANAQQSYGQQQRGDILSELLGAVFGQSPQVSEQVLESDWNQGRRPFEQRRAALDTRIDAAVRDGSLGRREAEDMRREYDEIVRLESEYAADGSISPQQRSDLRSRYRALSQRVGGQSYGQAGYQQGGYQNDGRWQTLSTRTGEFEQRIADRLRSRDLTRAEATQLRADWRSLSQLEAGYQRGGIDAREQADLWGRYNAIASRLGGMDGGTVDPAARWSDLERRLAAFEQNGRITRADAVHVRAQLGDLARLDAAYAMGGYSADQQAYLARRHGELDQLLGSRRTR